MNQVELSQTLRLLQAVADALDRDAPLMHALALLRIAAAGEAGLDQGRLEKELKASSASTSRTVQALSAVHYLKDRDGYGYVERAFDATDNRRRTLRLTALGRNAVDRIVSQVAKDR